MKRFIILLLCCMCISYIFAQYQVSYLSSTSSTITLRSVVYEKKIDKAMKMAQLSTLKTILFQGVDNAIQSSPLIDITENQAIKQHSKYFDSFYKSRYKEFIESSIISQGLQKDITKKKNAIFDITINIKALRRDLEQNGVIRKFGY